MQKEIELNDKYDLVIWYPGTTLQVSAYLADKTGTQISPLHVIALAEHIASLAVVRVSDSEARVTVNDTAVTVLVKETSITVISQDG